MRIKTTILSIVCLSVLLFTFNEVWAATSIDWDVGDGGIHSIFDGRADAIGIPLPYYQVTDTNLAGNGKIDTISVLVNSTTDPTGINQTLTEFGGDTGIFFNTGIIFSNGTGLYDIASSQTVGLNYSSLAGTGEIISCHTFACPHSLDVFSTTDPTGIVMNLTETGSHTGIFTNTLHFTTGSSIDGKSISVHGGDIVTVHDRFNDDVTNEIVTPNADPALGAVSSKYNDQVFVVYNGVKEFVTLGGGIAPGGGGGGLIRPSLVLDIIAALGGSPYIVSPPSFGGSYYHFSDGFTLNQGENGTKETFDISKYNTEIPKQVMVSGEKSHMIFKTFEGYNPTGVIGMTLYFIPRGQDLNIDASKSIADIEWKKGKPIEVDDPNHILSDVNASSNSDGKFQYTRFEFVPTKSYDKMSFIVRAWNDHMYTVETRLHDAVDTPAPVKILPTGVIQYNNFDNLYSALEKDGYLKPQVLAHIHDTNSVFGNSGAGKIFWLYDTINKTVTLVISDKNGNELAKTSSSLEPIPIEKQGDYGFMKFTTKQLNRWDEDDEKNAMNIEEEKAMELAQEKGISSGRNWQYYLP